MQVGGVGFGKSGRRGNDGQDVLKTKKVNSKNENITDILVL